MLKYNSKLIIANNLAEKDVEFNRKLNNNITKKQEEKIFVNRFKYYSEMLDKDEERITIDEDNETRTLIED